MIIIVSNHQSVNYEFHAEALLNQFKIFRSLKEKFSVHNEWKLLGEKRWLWILKDCDENIEMGVRKNGNVWLIFMWILDKAYGLGVKAWQKQFTQRCLAFT